MDVIVKVSLGNGDPGSEKSLLLEWWARSGDVRSCPRRGNRRHTFHHARPALG